MAPFVGREAERRAIDELLARALSSSGAAVVLTGATGIGKTRLAEEVVAGAAASFAVARAACGPPGAMPPFWPWAQLLGDILGPDEDLRRQAEREWPAAVRLADPHRPLGPTDAVPDHERARAELYRDVASLLAAAGARHPRLLVIDDLHHADPSTWLLLSHLAPRLRSLPVAVLATWRTGGLQPPSPVAAAMLRQAQAIAVPPLEVDQLRSLLDSLTGAAVNPSVAAAVHRRTSGNPLLALEVAAELGARGALDQVAAVEAVIPESTRALVDERRARLPPGCRSALAAAAAIGATFAVDVLAAALDQDGPAVLGALEPARATGLLRSLGPREGAFSHDLVRDVVFELETATARAGLHGRIAAALERLRTGGRAVEPADLARHFMAAGPDLAPQAAAYAREAGRQAMAMLAYEEAAAWLAQAAGAAGAGPVDPGPRAEFLLELGEAQEASGDRAGARATYLAASRAARSAERPDLLATAALGMSGTVGFEIALLDGEQIDLLREALDALAPQETARRASIMARLAVATSVLEDVEERAQMAEEAVALARSSGDPEALVQALAARCDAIAGPEYASVRAALAGEIVTIGTRRRDARLELLGRRLLIVALLEQGDVAAADREILAFTIAAAALRRPVYSWYVPLWRSMRAAMEGRIEEAWAALAEAEQAGREGGSENAVMLTTTLRWCLLAELDHRREIDVLLSSSGLEHIPGVWPLVVRSLCAAQGGRHGAARTLLDAAAARLPVAERDSEWLPMMGQVAEIVGLVGPHPIAAWAYDVLLPHRGLFAVEGIGAAVRGPVEHALGLLAAALGRGADARAHFDAAVAANERVGAAVLAARAVRDAGVALGDRSRLDEARRRYAALGMDARVAEIDARRGDVEVLPEAPTPNVFQREGEVWRVVYAGTEVRLRDAKGLRDLARLLADPARPVAAVDLAGAGVAGAQGDLGEVVDARARAAYRRRLADLDEEIDDADQAADIERSARAAAEKDALVAQLAAAYGLGGRLRRTGDPGERARQTVTARIRDAIGRIESAHPDLGRHLRRSVRTGRVCVYEPERPTPWEA